MGSGLDQYELLLARLDQKFTEIRGHYPKEFSCARGCHGCCRPGVTVNRLEAQALQNYFIENPDLGEKARALEASNPFKGDRCHFLEASGNCLVYEARPLVCRSHGAPLEMRSLEDEGVKLRDVCPLNFTGLDIVTLPSAHLLNLDTMNTLLALLSEMEFPGDESRTLLRVDALLGTVS
jgi:uncharacterized protein